MADLDATEAAETADREREADSDDAESESEWPVTEAADEAE